MDEKIKKMGQIYAKCWSDEAFKKKLISDPTAVLKEQGLDVPTGMTLHVVENTEKEVYLIIPPKPSKELGDEQLDKVAGGGSCSSTGGTIGCACIVTAGSLYSH